MGEVESLLADPRDGTVLGLGYDGWIVRVDPEHGKVIATGATGLVAPEDSKRARPSPADGVLARHSGHPHPRSTRHLLADDHRVAATPRLADVESHHR